MYESYFGLKTKPFGIVPDTRFLYLSASHREAIAHLLYAMDEKNGLVQLTGEVGTGKTMACRYLLGNMPENIDVALILNPTTGAVGLLKTICDELKISNEGSHSPSELSRKLNEQLLRAHAAGRQTILIIDEAQNLPKKTLEQVRLLTNLETNEQKLLRIILIGQPELNEILSHEDMRQVAQRITSRYHLGPLSRHESDAYIKHRLNVAGCSNPLFTPRALKKIFKLTRGVPRLINLLCDRALIGAYSLGTAQVDTAIVTTAAKEALPMRAKASGGSGGSSSKNIWLLLALSILLALAWYQREMWWPQLSSQLNQWQEKLMVRPDSTPDSTPAQNPEVDAFRPVDPEQKKKIQEQADLDFRLGIPAKVPDQK